MNFSEQLQNMKNVKVIEFANEFLEIIKPKLVEVASEGYSGYRHNIDESEKEKLQLYADELFVEHLNDHLDEVKVSYERDFVEILLLKGYGHYHHSLRFRW